MNETENTIEAFTAEDGTVYTPCETSEAEGLWSNGKFIEGSFEREGWFRPKHFAIPGSFWYRREWEPMNLIPVKKVMPNKEPLVWTGQAHIVNELNPGTYVNLPGYWSGKTVEVREVTEPEPAPELDLSPLTEEEFRRMRRGDEFRTVTRNFYSVLELNVIGSIAVIRATGDYSRLVEAYAFQGGLIPSEATARRLGRGVKS